MPSLTKTQITADRWRITRHGAMFLLAVVLVFTAAYGLNQSIFIFLAAIFLTLLLYNFFYLTIRFRHIDLEIKTPDPFYLGEASHVAVNIATNSFWNNLNDVTFQFDEEAIPATWIDRWTKNQNDPVHLSIEATSRGVFHVSQLNLSSGYPFGFFTRTRMVPTSFDLVVYPRLLPEDANPLGQASQVNAGLNARTGEFYYLEDYREGEDVRHIHWRKSASRTVPVVVRDQQNREFQKPRLFVPDPCPQFEWAISAIATLVAHGPQQIDWALAGQQHIHYYNDKWVFLEALATVSPLVKASNRDHWQTDGRLPICASDIQPVNQSS